MDRVNFSADIDQTKYEKGINHLVMSCRMRQLITIKQYYVKKEYLFYDLMKNLVNKRIDTDEWATIKEHSIESTHAI